MQCSNNFQAGRCSKEFPNPIIYIYIYIYYYYYRKIFFFSNSIPSDWWSAGRFHRALEPRIGCLWTGLNTASQLLNLLSFPPKSRFRIRSFAHLFEKSVKLPLLSAPPEENWNRVCNPELCLELLGPELLNASLLGSVPDGRLGNMGGNCTKIYF